MQQGLNLEDWKKTISDAYGLHCRKIQFIGGEPTLYPHLIELISFARSLGYTFVEVYTNGTVLTDKLKEAFIKYKVNLAFSVYSFDKSVHDAITLKFGSQEKTIESIKWSIKSGLSIRAAIIDIGLNSSTIEKTKQLLTEIGVTSVDIDRNRGIGRGSKSVKSTSPMDELCGNCWKGKLCVTPSGEIFPCVFSRFISIGNVLDGLENILLKRELIDFRLQMKQHNQTNKRLRFSADCSPDECSPDGGGCEPDCTPNAYCSPEHDDPDDCSPMVGGCSPNEK